MYVLHKLKDVIFKQKWIYPLLFPDLISVRMKVIVYPKITINLPVVSLLHLTEENILRIVFVIYNE